MPLLRWDTTAQGLSPPVPTLLSAVVHDIHIVTCCRNKAAWPQAFVRPGGSTQHAAHAKKCDSFLWL